jgi:uncharacterized protein YdeI (YjbR/CyaY-like superfamily)
MLESLAASDTHLFSVKFSFFKSASELRAWLEANYARTNELWIGFYKKLSGKPSVTYSEAVDEALCFGWIDGLRKSLDATAYTIRFTPRKPKSKWSAVNIKRMKRLIEAERLHMAGLKAFEGAQNQKRAYSYEQRSKAKLHPAGEKQFRANKKGWLFFQAQAPWYRRTAIFWVISAKKEETRHSRLARLIDYSARGQTIPPLTRRSVPKR